MFLKTQIVKQQPPQCEKSEFFLFVIQVLRNVVLFLVLSPYDNEQSDLIHRVGEEKTLEEISLYRYVMLNEI